MPGVKLSDIVNGSIELANFHNEMLVSIHIFLSCQCLSVSMSLILPCSSLFYGFLCITFNSADLMVM